MLEKQSNKGFRYFMDTLLFQGYISLEGVKNKDLLFSKLKSLGIEFEMKMGYNLIEFIELTNIKKKKKDFEVKL